MPNKVGDYELLEALEVYNAFRGKINSEDTLINWRLSWMLWAEAIFLAAWGALAAIEKSDHLYGNIIIPVSMVFANIFGIAIAIASFLSLRAAVSEITKIKYQYKTAYGSLYNSNNKIPKLYSGKNNHGKGTSIIYFVPILFGFVQLSGIAYVLFINLFNHTPSPDCTTKPISQQEPKRNPRS